MAEYINFTPAEATTIGVCHTEDLELRPRLRRRERLVDWQPPLAVLQDGGFADLLATDVVTPLCSPRLRDALDRLRGPEDDLEWLPCEVRDEAGDRRSYYFLRVSSHPGVLHDGRTIRAGDFVVKPVLNRSRTGAHQIFTFAEGSSRIIVSEEVKRAVESGRFTGILFEKAAAV